MTPDISSAETVAAAVALLRRHSATRVALTGTAVGHQSNLVEASGANGWFDPDAPDGSFDGVVIVEKSAFPLMMRRLEPLARRDALVIPADPDWVVDPATRNMAPLEAAWHSKADVNYVSRSALRGHYVEFGTFWGRSFFPAYHRLKDWLDGSFYAFDSFKGISAPLPAEYELTGGDFAEGAYACNVQSFNAIAELCGAPRERLKIIPGFYSESLVGHDPINYGLQPKSISLCVVDCDLYQPTVEVLEFISPLLDDGALIYFDDWRLCRASPKVGERGAALEWLAANPQFELIDFPGDTPIEVSSWQHAWFIFQRR